ncbi:MAG: peptide-methionine (S)-S-oxide reductase MsrA [Candidatus Dormibacteraeota bacterium]|nr:peptide-methionine (S)-S-oxide reductase MsrA [Candidatus Dormibacteraeota bacterium]MBV9524433.1 peptide-methionine (S)-S-oxide reductase MsrA [Candidatus Dormibacteraeota bacterium]
MEKATFAAGCFWGVESVFEQVPGVVATRVGYAGGRTEHPSYKEVCSGRTGHAEAVEVTFDPEKVGYGELVSVFFMNHDPTTRNRQGPDVGEQYRSVVFYDSPEQKKTAEDAVRRLESEGRFKRPIVTEVVPAGRFWEAEEYHQKYFSRRGMVASCHLPAANVNRTMA